MHTRSFADYFQWRRIKPLVAVVTQAILLVVAAAFTLALMVAAIWRGR